MPTKTIKKPAARASKPSTAQTKAGTKPTTKAPSATKPAAKTSTKSPAKKPAPSSKDKPQLAPEVPSPAPTLAATASLRTNSKQSQLIELLKSKGATIPQMSELTGWQTHTVRATLSAVFRKRLGLNLEVSKVDGSTSRLYRIIGQAAA